MTLRTFLLAFVLSLLSTAWAVPVAAQDRSPLPSQHHTSVQPARAVPLEKLPAVDTRALRREDERESDRIGPQRYGTVIETDFDPARHGHWESLPNGQSLWRLRIQSREAVSLSVAFTRFELPEGASVYVHGPEGSVVRGPYTRADVTNGEHWTPVVPGEELIVELGVPSDRRSEVDLVVGKVIHAYRALYPDQSETSKAGACNIDVACDEADPWRDQVRSVARFTFESGGGTYYCSGSLVNNTAENNRPFFLTAEHCISTETEATSMVFYWNYQNPTCRDPGSVDSGQETTDDPNNQTSTGAVLRARYGNWHVSGSIAGKPDLTLVEIDDDIPLDYNLYFNGWSWRDATTTESVTIHHPSRDGKRISMDSDPTTLVDYPSSTCNAPQGTTHLLIEDWERGTTEGGSSGAPLYNTDQRVVGVLSGGCAGCDGDGDGDDNNAPDWYGRLAVGFDQGDYQGNTFADWLDPMGSGQQTIGGRPMSNDTIPPAQVPNFRVASVSPDSITLRWEAPGDDGMQGTAASYDLRYRHSEAIMSKSAFQTAQKVSDLPPPEPAGTPQSTTIAVGQDTSYFFALEARDEALNTSPLATIDRDVTPVTGLRITRRPSPNPARHRTTVSFVVQKQQSVRAALHDALGRQISVVYDQSTSPYRKQTLTADVSSLSSGIYFLRFRGTDATRTEKIAVVK